MRICINASSFFFARFSKNDLEALPDLDARVSLSPMIEPALPAVKKIISSALFEWNSAVGTVDDIALHGVLLNGSSKRCTLARAAIVPPPYPTPAPDLFSRPGALRRGGDRIHNPVSGRFAFNRPAYWIAPVVSEIFSRRRSVSLSASANR
jgi:hypothetical protein